MFWDRAALTAYDRTICMRDLTKIMKAWLNLPRAYTKVVYDNSENIVGYASIRIVVAGKLDLAPFYVENLEAAEVLLNDLLESIPNWEQYRSINFLYPETNKGPLKLLETFSRNKESVDTDIGIRSQFTKHLYPTPDHKVYSIFDDDHQFV